jgi:hypothetical protein
MGSVFAASVPETIVRDGEHLQAGSLVVGSTAFSARLDPEDLRKIVAAHQKCAADTVRRAEGFVPNISAMGCWLLSHCANPRFLKARAVPGRAWKSKYAPRPTQLSITPLWTGPLHRQ